MQGQLSGPTNGSLAGGTIKAVSRHHAQLQVKHMIGAYRLMLPIRAVHQMGPCYASALATFVWPFFERTNEKMLLSQLLMKYQRSKSPTPLYQERWKTGKRLWRSLLLSPIWPEVKRGSCCEKAKGKRRQKEGLLSLKGNKITKCCNEEFHFWQGKMSKILYKFVLCHCLDTVFLPCVCCCHGYYCGIKSIAGGVPNTMHKCGRNKWNYNVLKTIGTIGQEKKRKEMIGSFLSFFFSLGNTHTHTHQ